MKNLIAASLVIFLLVAGYGCTDNARTSAKSGFPATIEEIERMSRNEIAALPDVKAPLGEPIRESALAGKNKVMLRILRNSIFAQYGYPFTIKWIRDYFETRDWYRPGNFNAASVSAADTANVRLIRQFEESVNPSTPYDRAERMNARELKQLPDIRAELDKPVDESTLKKMSKRELKMLRNSIYAQYGRSFKTPWLQKYFDTRPWYKRGPFSDNLLTRTDLKNVALIKQYEVAGENIAEKELLDLGYCEKESDYEIERFVFKSGKALEYTRESQNPYGRSTEEGRLSGEWRPAPGGAEYRFEDDGEWEPLQIDVAEHACR